MRTAAGLLSMLGEREHLAGRSLHCQRGTEVVFQLKGGCPIQRVCPALMCVHARAKYHFTLGHRGLGSKGATGANFAEKAEKEGAHW
jgi:hypothetical protein